MDASTTYILQRILADVDFLRQQSHIQEHQATAIKAQLDPLLESSADHLASQFQAALPSPSRASAASSLSAVPSSSFQRTNSRTESIASAARNKVPPPPPSSKFATPPPPVEQHQPRDTVKALWTFEAAGGADELPFKVGDIIHVFDRSDADWWTGTVNGREGVFPSNYTEPCEDPAPPPSYPSDPEKASLAASSTTPRWQPPKARFTSGTPTSSHASPVGLAPVSSPSSSSSQYPPAGGPGGLAPAPTTEEEKKRQEKLKKLGGRMGTAVATGAGFGVGAGLVSSMF